jgi:hypothetical protein
MTNPTAATQTVTLKGRDYALAFDFAAIADAEDITGRSLITGLKRKDVDSPAVKLVQAMFWACTRRTHPELTYSEAQALITPKNMARTWTAILNVWVAGMAEAEDGEPGEAQAGS